MAIVWTRVCRAALIALLCWAAPGWTAEKIGALRYSAADRDALKRAARLELPSLRSALSNPVEYRLAPLTSDELPRLVADDQPPLAGGHRKLAADTLDAGRWESLPGGRQIWRLAIHSPEAAGLRLHFAGFSAGSGRVWVHDGSRDESEIQGPYTGTGPYGDGEFWSDFVLAETIVVEFEPDRPESAGQPPPFRIAEVTHLFPGVLPLSSLATRPAAASCNLDVSCYPAWAETAKSVGHIVYEKEGSAYVCSGTLLNTRNSSGVPYFLTADHCVNTDAVARTVQAFWFYQTQSCNGPAVTRREAIRTLGAQYMAGGEKARGDFTLLRLNEVPSGVVFSGWQTQEVAEGADLAGIHHPAGDYKRIWFGTRASGRPPFGADPAAFLTLERTSGLAEPGSSGSGLFSAPEVLVGVLSHGPKVDDSELLCAMNPLRVNYGKFSNAYPVVRDFLEDRAPNPPPPPPASGTPRTIASGASQSFSFDAVASPTLFRGGLAYQIAVPPGATQLEIRLATSTPNADTDLYVRFGSEPVVSSGTVVADHSSTGSTGNETLTVTSSSSPPLRPGTYYIAIAVMTANISVAGTVTATVTTAAPPPPPGGPAALTSGVAQNFTIGPVSVGTLFNGNRSYTINVPQGATRLEIRLVTSTPNVDVDLFARFGADPALSGGNVVADHGSDGPAGDETIIVTPSSSPPLRPGTYYISLGLLTTGATVSGTLTATVTSGAPPAGGPVTLTSGTPQSFSIAAVTSAVLLTGSSSYQINVPQGATRLDVRLATATPGVDIDLFVRYGTEATVSAGRVVADYESSGPAGDESISITPNSTPALRPGTYYIALAIFTTGVSASGTLTATVTTGSGPPPGTGPITLTSGVAQTFTFEPVSSPVLMNGARSYVITVPQGATRLEIQLATATPDVDIDLFARYGSDLSVAAGRVVADHSSEGPAGNESIAITPTSSPPLRPGTYYIALVVFTANVTVSGSVRATVSAAAPPPPTGPTVLTSGRPQNFAIGPYSNPTLLTGSNSYVVDVPDGATRLDVQLVTATAGVDLDLFARYGADNTVADGSVVADHSSDGPTGGERITVTPSSSPPLRPGRYYISLAIYTTDVSALGTLTATVSTTAPPAPPPANTTELTSGVPAKFNLPAVERPTLFTGAYSYRIIVPEGAASLKVQVVSAVPAIDVDLYIRYESDVDLSPDGEVVADYRAEGDTGNEVLTIGAGSNPPLRPGAYYIALALYTTGTASTGTVTATVERPSITPPVSTTRPLVSGRPAQFSLPAVERPTFFSGEYGFRITVPPGSGKLEISLRTDTAGADVDLFARFGAEPQLADGRIVADYRSTSDSGNEFLVIEPLSVPPLRAGVYFIAVALYTTGVATQGTITATVTPAAGGGAQGLSKAEPLDAPPGLPLAPKRGWAVELPISALTKQETPAELFKRSDSPVKKKPGRYVLHWGLTAP